MKLSPNSKTFGNKDFTSGRANLCFLNPSLYCQPVPTSRSTSLALPDPAQKAPPQILQTPSEPHSLSVRFIKEPLLSTTEELVSSLQTACSCSFCCTHNTMPLKTCLQQRLNKWGHLLSQACVWAHSSSRNPRNRKSCQSQLSCHHQNAFWTQIQRWHLVWSCTFWPVFPEFLF